MSMPGWPPGRRTGELLGALLVAAGLVLLVAQYARIDLGQYGWPLFVIVPGLALLLIGFLTAGASGLLVPGAIVTATGLVLAVQNTFDLWATWAYAWALIAPGAAGVGIALQGRVRGSPGQVEAGLRTAAIGLGLFVVFGAFFEGVGHVSGLDLGAIGQLVLPLALIVVGLALLAARWFSSRAARPPVEPQPAAPPAPPSPPPAGSGGL
jgi:hypothetical protein